ncbi:MAG: ATP-binding cassette domain-containing protein [Planctomycetes bacterium]|nr:ATP-binding cassette domain-containing protein [Planctomycetota bacterium]
MIRVQHLTKFYGSFPAVRDVSFEVGRGEIVGFLGPNGAGKTTTMKVLTCFLPATSGTVTTDGLDNFENSLEVRRKIGYLPENAPLYLDMVVRDFLLFVARVRGLAPDTRRRRLDEMVRVCNLQKVFLRPIGELSKGYRQRVGLAQALIHDPDFLLLDEPTAGLDPNQIFEVRNAIREIGRTKTIILSTHILQEVSAMCGRVIVIDRGRKVMEGNPARPSEMLTPAAAARFSRVVATVAGAGVSTETVAAAFGQERFARDLACAPAGDGAVTATIALADDGAGAAEAIFRKTVALGWALRELRVSGATLEDAFRELTTGETQADRPAPLTGKAGDMAGNGGGWVASAPHPAPAATPDHRS